VVREIVFVFLLFYKVDRDNSVGIATPYGRDGAGTENSPSSLRRGSAAVRLLELRVWIPPEAWMRVLCVLSEDKKSKCRTMKTKKQENTHTRTQTHTQINWNIATCSTALFLPYRLNIHFIVHAFRFTQCPAAGTPKDTINKLTSNQQLSSSACSYRCTTAFFQAKLCLFKMETCKLPVTASNFVLSSSDWSIKPLTRRNIKQALREETHVPQKHFQTDFFRT
jgi:hypothetical protein